MLRTPKFWLCLCCEEWATPRPLAQDSWQALVASRGPAPTTLRQWILMQPYVNPTHFRQQHTPQSLVDVLEILVLERRLAPLQATALEEHILRTVTATGAWRD